MRVPYKVLTEALLTRQDVALYAALARLRAAATGELAEAAGLPSSTVLASLHRLAESGCIFPLGKRWTVLTFRQARPRGSRAPSASTSGRRTTTLPLGNVITNNTNNINKRRERARARQRGVATVAVQPIPRSTNLPTSRRKEVSKPQPRMTSKEALAAARVDSRKPPAEWSTIALAGLFIECWERHYEIEYRAALNTTLSHIEKLRDDQGELAYWCIEAVFSEDMSWVKANRLDFLSNPSNCQKWIAPIALNQRKAAGGEVVRDDLIDDDSFGVVHDPLNRK